MATVDHVRALASALPRSYEALVRDRVKFRVGQIVYVAFSADDLGATERPGQPGRPEQPARPGRPAT